MFDNKRESDVSLANPFMLNQKWRNGFQSTQNMGSEKTEQFFEEKKMLKTQLEQHRLNISKFFRLQTY